MRYILFASLFLATTIGAVGCGSNNSAVFPDYDASQGDDDSIIDGGHVVVPDADPVTPGCGTCPTGYVCGSANGTPVCRAPSGIPQFSNIYIVLMENTSYATLEATTNTPFLHGLGDTWARASDYHGVIHPSLANYIALVSGDTYGIGCDCDATGGACNGLTCNALVHSCGCPQTAGTIADQIEAAGLDWRNYAEGMGTPCNLTSAGKYAVRHVPFLYFSPMVADTARCNAHVVDYAQLATELAAPPEFVFISPDLVNDMHDPFPAGAQNYANGDAWLSAQMAPIMARPELQPGGKGILIIVWDEDDLSGFPNPDDPIPMYMISPLAKKGGYLSTVRADHYGMLATIEDGLGLPRLGKAIGVTPLVDLFPAQ